MKNGAARRLVIGCVADLTPADVEIVVEKEAHLAVAPGLISHLDSTHEQILVEVDGVLADQTQFQMRVVKDHLGDQIVTNIVERPLPTVVAYPRKLPIGPHTKPRGVSCSVILLTNVRPVEIAEPVSRVEVNQ